jgi:hypothetical protein
MPLGPKIARPYWLTCFPRKCFTKTAGSLGLGGALRERLDGGTLANLSSASAAQCCSRLCMASPSSAPFTHLRLRLLATVDHSSFFLPAEAGKLWTSTGRGGAYPLWLLRAAAGRDGLAVGDRPIFAICRSAEAVIAGGSPGCTLSKRAAAKLDDVKTRLPFIDSTSVPVVSNEGGSVRIWTFAGGLVNSALARATGGNATRADDFCIMIDPADAAQISIKLAGLNAKAVTPPVPEKLIEQLKFRECLPDELAMAVVEARLSDLEGIRATLDRPRRIIRDIQ